MSEPFSRRQRCPHREAIAAATVPASSSSSSWSRLPPLMEEPERARESELGSRGEKRETRASHRRFCRSKSCCRRWRTHCRHPPPLLVVLNCCTVVAAVLVTGCGVGDHRNHHRSYRYFSSAVHPCLGSSYGS